ncbi:lanthionine synthetase LanC family protein, partial [Amycolatopsis sp. NPDC003861]
AALHRAGGALGEPGWCDAAVGALRAVLARDEREWRLDGPTVCHGYAGLLQVVRRVGTASGDPVLLDGCARLTTRVLSFADPDAAFVFPHLVPDSPRGWQDATAHRRLDVAGMLEGAAGVACALLPAAGAWDTALMLA